MYIHGHFYNEKDEKVEVHILTHDDRTEEMEIGAEGGTPRRAPTAGAAPCAGPGRRNGVSNLFDKREQSKFICFAERRKGRNIFKDSALHRRMIQIPSVPSGTFGDTHRAFERPFRACGPTQGTAPAVDNRCPTPWTAAQTRLAHPRDICRNGTIVPSLHCQLFFHRFEERPSCNV